MEETHAARRTLHPKRSFKHSLSASIDSPAYDASGEDEDEAVDDRASAALPTTGRNAHVATSSPLAQSSSTAKDRTPLAPKAKLPATAAIRQHVFEVSDSGTDSPTYDGDVESTTTVAAHPRPAYHHHSSSLLSTSSLNSPSATPPTLPITQSSGSREMPLDDAQTATHIPQDQVASKAEPVPVIGASPDFNPATLTPEDIQAFVRKALAGETPRSYKINPAPQNRPVRIYADGVYDIFHFGHALQLRQAKLSFPSVYLLVGVCSDELVRDHKSNTVMTHTERCESVRHCRWVDEVVKEAPWVIDEAFIAKYEIDYVAHDDDPYKGIDTDDVYGYVKTQGKFIPTRRTPGVSTSELLERIVSGYRQGEFDKKLETMGHAELRSTNVSRGPIED